MKTLICSILAVILLIASPILAQDSLYQNTGSQIINATGNLSIRGYAQIDYNQKLDSEVRYNGMLDVHRMVLFFGYKFSNKTSFISEVEIEHVSEVFIEQAFVNHKLSRFANLRAGMLLIPMGIVNEYHEPPTFHGVERPNLDKNIVPTTWRELGAGLQGNVQDANLNYQVYLVNGFKSYDDEGLLRGIDGLRKGRQKGIESIISHPNLATKIDFYGLKNLNVGASLYTGKTSSTLFDGLQIGNDTLEKAADSSIVGLSMIGLDARYQYKGLQVRGQYIMANLTNTLEYNTFTGNDLGSEMTGFFIEVAYEIMQHLNKNAKTQLFPFIRYEKYNTHSSVEEISKNKAYDRTEITTGLTLKLNEGVALKGDLQFLDNEALDKAVIQLNLGVGIWF